MVPENHHPPAEFAQDSDSDYNVYFEYFVGSRRPGMFNASREWCPAADVYETEDCVLIKVDIAGIDKEDVSLVLDKDTLVLKGERRELLDNERKHAMSMEVPYGPFSRTFDLPSLVSADDVKADYNRGFLTIRLRKCDESPEIGRESCRERV